MKKFFLYAIYKIVELGHMKKFFLYAIYIIVGGSLLFGLLQIILVGYSLSWTGFGEYTLTNGNVVQEKKLWDWMELLIIPMVLAGGALFLNRSERNTERKNLKDRQQEAAFQSYIDRMANLLLEEKLRTTREEEVRDVSRTRTLTALRGLDANRKAQVIQFLHEANLINKTDVVVNLEGADLKLAQLKDANLEEANLADTNLVNANLGTAILNNANLEHANLEGANLEHAFLVGSNMQGVDLYGAKLDFATLKGANLGSANLEHANLEHANLEGANLEGAYLEDANLKYANLKGAKLKLANLKDANLEEAYLEEAYLMAAFYNAKTKWPNGFDPKSANAIYVSPGEIINVDEKF